MLCGVAGAWADTKVALVIGNSHYTSPIPALSNPTNDATDIAASLKKVGFDVVLKTELDKAQFDKTLADFARAASNADVALFITPGTASNTGGKTTSCRWTRRRATTRTSSS